MRKIPHFLDKYSPGESLDLLRDFALSHAVQGGPLGQDIARLIRASDFRSLCEFEVDYLLPLTVSQFAHCRQALAFFSKLEDLDIGIDKERVALDKFISAERLCRETNSIFRKWSRGEFSFSPRVDAVLFRAQRKIAHVLGSVPSLEKLRFRFGPGATTLTKKRDASSRRKLHDGIACSKDFVHTLPRVLGEMPAWSDLHDYSGNGQSGRLNSAVEDYYSREQVSSLPEHLERLDVESIPTETGSASIQVQLMNAELCFVAKNAKTYRAIGTEPPLNGVYQLALGDHIAKRLARFGVDLSDRYPNQVLAKEGSLTGALATLDLSSASDTVAIELVYHLLPVDWALALAAGRTSTMSYKDDVIVLEKFSSMGNGYTFALESLIFWALASSCGADSDTIRVYGDDIIVATHNVGLLTEVLTACGFILNKEKSFSSGPFRESCGADYYRGFDIRPFYQKEWVNAAGLFKLHNFYVRHGDDERAKNVLKHIDPSLILYGPDGFGDGHLVGDHPHHRKVNHVRLGYSGYVFDTFKQLGKREESRPIAGDYVFALYTIYQRSAEPIGVNGTCYGSHLSVHQYAASYSALKHLRHGSFAGDPLPELLVDGVSVKRAALPGVDGYKRVSIYTLGA